MPATIALTSRSREPAMSGRLPPARGWRGGTRRAYRRHDSLPPRRCLRDRAGRPAALDQHRQALLSGMVWPGRLSAGGRGAILAGDAAWLRNSPKRYMDMSALTLDQASIIVDKALE